MNSLFEMGQFGGFIWASYAIAALALMWMFVASWARARTLAKKLRAMMQEDASDNNDNDKIT